MPILRLAYKSLLNRRFTVLITLLSIAFSSALLLGVERLRHDARSGFANTISGVDLLVGARSGSIQLLLYSVFHIGHATNNISWKSYQEIARQRQVAWAVPLSLGDSHRGFRVLGTEPAFFQHFRYARDRALSFAQGAPFKDVYDVVLGAEVAERYAYRVGDELVMAHGAGKVSLVEHKDRPFRVSGVLRKTGTPLDRTLLASLQGIEAMHVGWFAGVAPRAGAISADQARAMDLTPNSITAALLGLKSKISTFHVQRFINEYRAEPLLAILPGVALQELWDLMSVAENALLAVSAMVVLVGLSGMLTALLAGLNERRREMAILRSLGARPLHILSLIVGEALFLTLLGLALGLAMLYGVLALAAGFLQTEYGLFISLSALTPREWGMLAMVLALGAGMGLIPGYRAYRFSLHDGLSVRL